MQTHRRKSALPANHPQPAPVQYQASVQQHHSSAHLVQDERHSKSQYIVFQPHDHLAPRPAPPACGAMPAGQSAQMQLPLQQMLYRSPALPA